MQGTVIGTVAMGLPTSFVSMIFVWFLLPSTSGTIMDWPLKVFQKVCTDADLHPLFHLSWNGKNISIYKVFDRLSTGKRYFIYMNNLLESRIYISAKFLNDKVAYLESVSRGMVLSIPFVTIFSDFESLEYFYANEHLNLTRTLRMVKTRTDTKKESLWSLVLHINARSIKLRGELRVICEKEDCTFDLTLKTSSKNVIWQVKGMFLITIDGGIFIAKSSNEEFVVDIHWSNNQQGSTAIVLINYGTESLFNAKLNYLNQTRESRIFAEVFSETLDFQCALEGMVYVLENESFRVTLSLIANYVRQLSNVPLRYSFDLQQGNGNNVFDLRHNLTSMLYLFEGNMTVDMKKSYNEPEIITRIWQKIRSPISKSFRLDLEQIINRTGSWSWETTAMKSRILNMHVSALWNDNILDFYKKNFVFISNDEDLVPSFSLTISYSNQAYFYHRFHFPLKAVAYEIFAKHTYSRSVSTSTELEIFFQDEFKSNLSTSIASICLRTFKDYYEMNYIAKPELESTLKGVFCFFRKLFNVMADENGVIRKISDSVIMYPIKTINFHKLSGGLYDQILELLK